MNICYHQKKKEFDVLKRYQVLLPDWLEDYIKHLVDAFDLSFSEVIRAEICCTVLATVPALYPEYKPGFKHQDILDMIKKNFGIDLEREETHRLLSKIYFEARKAAEYRLEKEKKPKKK